MLSPLLASFLFLYPSSSHALLPRSPSPLNTLRTCSFSFARTFGFGRSLRYTSSLYSPRAFLPTCTPGLCISFLLVSSVFWADAILIPLRIQKKTSMKSAGRPALRRFDLRTPPTSTHSDNGHRLRHITDYLSRVHRCVARLAALMYGGGCALTSPKCLLESWGVSRRCRVGGTSSLR